jgi:hypothetical protein
MVSHVAVSRARTNDARSPVVRMQTTQLGLVSAAPAALLTVSTSLMSALVSGGERQSDRECPNGERPSENAGWGENRWPSVERSDGRRWGEMVAADGRR